MKDELRGKVMTKFVALRAKTELMMIVKQKRQNEQKICVITRMLKFNDYKNCVLNNKVVLKSQQRFKYHINIYLI